MLRYSIAVIAIFLWSMLTVFSSPKGTGGSETHLSTADLRIQHFKTANGWDGWQVDLPGKFQLATPCVVDGMVYIGGGFGSYEFYAFDATSGRPVWRIKVNDDGPTAAVVEDGYCVFNTESCTIFVVEARTGKMVWSKWLGDPLMSQPALAKGRIYMAYPGEGGHHLVCLAVKDGYQYWDKRIAGDIISAPVVDKANDLVYLTTFDGTVYCYETGDGALQWSKQYRATSAPFIANGQVYVSQREGDEKPYEGLTVLGKGGKIITGLMDKRQAPQIDITIQAESEFQTANMKDSTGVGFASAPPAANAQSAETNVGQNSVAGLWGYQGSRLTIVDNYSFSSRGDTLQRYDLKNNKVVWEKKISGDINQVGGHLASPPVVVNNWSIIGTVNGEIICFDNDTGRTEWSHKIEQSIRFQPAVMNGRIYVGTTGGRLVCVDTGNKELTGWPMWGGDAGHNGAIPIPGESVRVKPGQDGVIVKITKPGAGTNPPAIHITINNPATQTATILASPVILAVCAVGGIFVLLLVIVIIYSLAANRPKRQ